MKIQYRLYLFLAIWIIGCSTDSSNNPVQTGNSQEPNVISSQGKNVAHRGNYLAWGLYQLNIAYDGSYSSVLPVRQSNTIWGYHINALKFLEADPCTNCLSVNNVHMLPDGILSADISITHPFSNPAYTGFDVRGIIMFKGSQVIPDDELRIQAGLSPVDVAEESKRWISSPAKGDAVLVNADGWTSIWNPIPRFYEDVRDIPQDTEYPIFKYFPGKYAGDDEGIASYNAFKHYWSNDTRHMFEVGKTVTRTYIIKPPASGPIEALYAIYAHWAEPLVMPVTNPATDFGPEANSPMPYEFWVTQDSVLDPDVPDSDINSLRLHWHIRTWDIGYEKWMTGVTDLMWAWNLGWEAHPHPSGEPDDYWLASFHVNEYSTIAQGQPCTGTYVFYVDVRDPNDPSLFAKTIGRDFYIADIQIGALDGEW